MFVLCRRERERERERWMVGKLSYIFMGNVKKCSKALVYKLFLKIFYEKMIKKLILLIAFHIFYKSNVKTF